MKKIKAVNWMIIVGIVVMCMPMVVCTLYTYPVQDDFFNTWNVRQVMQEGHSAFGAAFIMAIRGWSDYSGYYFSLFLTYYTDAVVQCSIGGIRACQFLMAICFYLSVFLLIKTTIVRVFKYDDRYLPQIVFLFFVCLTSMYYFVEHEDFLWFCASVIYLIPMIFIFVGIICMIYVLDTERYRYLIIPMLLGFLSGGAVLNIAAFGCIVYIMTAYWGIVIKRRITASVCMCIPMLFAGIINLIAPGNFIRRGKPLTGEEILSTAIGTYHYVLSRVKMFLLHYPLFAAVLIALIVILFLWKPKNLNYKFYVPLLFTFMMFLAVWIVIFPVALGYGMNIYYMMERSNFVSDFVIFLAAFLTIFYWRGWMAVKFSKVNIKEKYEPAAILLIFLIFMISIIMSVKMDHIASLRIYRELIGGQIPAYAQWNVSVIEKIEDAVERAGEGDCIEIQVNKMEDNVCLINPKFWYGYYDPDVEFANGSLARFYGVDTVYIYDE